MIRHLASVAEIVDDVDAAAKLYEKLGLVVRREQEGYAVVELRGVLHFGLWSREEAATSTFGDSGSADRIPLGFTVGFEVDDVDDEAIVPRHAMLRGAEDEPWGQRTLRFVTASGALAELSVSPWARRLTGDLQVEG